MKGNDRPIGIFDSGLGGLTVYKAVRELLPGENVIYFGDTARVPYGTKSPEAVIKFSKEIARYLFDRNIKFLIVACNTASSLALEAIRRISPVPVMGVIAPGVDAALDFTQLVGFEFRPVDELRFPCFRLARQVMAAGGVAPAIYNAANEVAVAAFLAGSIPFLAIPRVIEQTLQTVENFEPDTLAAVLDADAGARRTAAAQLKKVS